MASLEALLKRLALREASQRPVVACDNPVLGLYHLPGARTSGLPFVATVFWRFMTRLCLPGIVTAWFSLPACMCGMFCGGWIISEWTWEQGKRCFPGVLGLMIDAFVSDSPGELHVIAITSFAIYLSAKVHLSLRQKSSFGLFLNILYQTVGLAAVTHFFLNLFLVIVLSWYLKWMDAIVICPSRAESAVLASSHLRRGGFIKELKCKTQGWRIILSSGAWRDRWILPEGWDLKLLPYAAGVVDVIGNVLQCEPLSSLLSFQKHPRASIGREVELLHHHIFWDADLLPQVQTPWQKNTEQPKCLTKLFTQKNTFICCRSLSYVASGSL